MICVENEKDLIAVCEECKAEKKIDSPVDLIDENWRVLSDKKKNVVHCLCSSCSDRIDALEFREMVGID